MTGRRAVPRPLARRGGPCGAGTARASRRRVAGGAAGRAVRLRRWPAPLPAALAAAPAGASVPGILAELAAGDFLVLDAGGQVSAAYPFSAAPTPHQVRLPGGVTLHAMCTVDALGIPPMLGTDAIITSSEPGTAEPVTITVTAGHAHWDPPGTVALYAWRDCSGPAAETCCDLISFFTSRKAARIWARTRPRAGAVILSASQASQLGTDIFGSLLNS